MSWLPRLPFGEGPSYQQIVDALEHDVLKGIVRPGDRLPTHREMAERLGLSVGTVSKAFAAAERRGLISGEVGRGTFAQQPAGLLQGTEEDIHRGPVNLALNAPPSSGESDIIGQTLTELSANGALPELLRYLPHQGLKAHREVLADWLRPGLKTSHAQQLFITNGAQHAISAVARILAKPDATILTENLPYSGIVSLAIHAGYRLEGLDLDREGVTPDSLQLALSSTSAKLVYLTPTLQAATGAIMGDTRRQEIADIIAAHDAYLIEDDAYGFLPDPAAVPISEVIPERSFYVMSFAKCLSPGLRIGALVAPPAFRDRIINSIRSTGWMANPIMAEAVVRMTADGSIDEQIRRKRVAAAERMDIAEEVLGDRIERMSDVPGFHVWLKLPAGRSLSAFVSQAAQRGVTVSPPQVVNAHFDMSDGLRLCLGGAGSVNELRTALSTVAAVLQDDEAMSLV